MHDRLDSRTQESGSSRAPLARESALYASENKNLAVRASDYVESLRTKPNSSGPVATIKRELHIG